MEQHQFRVKISLSTKLLRFTVSVIVLVIVFLIYSTYLLLRDDKTNYTYEMQKMESVLAGKEFTNLAANAIENLRIALSITDPTREITLSQRQSLTDYLDNQTLFTAISVRLLDPNSGKTFTTAQAVNEKHFAESKESLSSFEIDAKQLFEESQNIQKNGYALFNLSKIGHPYLGVFYADIRQKTSATGIPSVFGLVSLSQFGRDLNSADLSITDRMGRILFSTDVSLLYNRRIIQNDLLFKEASDAKFATGSIRFSLGETPYLGSFTRPGLDTVVIVKTPYNHVMRATYDLTEKFILLGISAIGFAVLASLLISKKTTVAINQVSDELEHFQSVGPIEYHGEAKVKTDDEIEVLGNGFNQMTKTIKKQTLEIREAAELKQEVEVAEKVQKTLFPETTYQDDLVKVLSYYKSASKCGGDWVGHFRAGNQLVLLIADATGHGVGPALVTAAAKSCFSVIERLVRENPNFALKPAHLLQFANQIVYETGGQRKADIQSKKTEEERQAEGILGETVFMTFFVGLVDLEKRTLKYASAAHNPPWIFSKTNDGFESKALMARGQRLGEMPNPPEYEEKEVQLGKDDILFLYTDGLVEDGKTKKGNDGKPVKDEKGTIQVEESFGKKRARLVLEQILKKDSGTALVDLFGELVQFKGDDFLSDDVTMALVQFNASNEPSAGSVATV